MNSGRLKAAAFVCMSISYIAAPAVSDTCTLNCGAGANNGNTDVGSGCDFQSVTCYVRGCPDHHQSDDSLKCNSANSNVRSQCGGGYPNCLNS
jgi:hypothetical protein